LGNEKLKFISKHYQGRKSKNEIIEINKYKLGLYKKQEFVVDEIFDKNLDIKINEIYEKKEIEEKLNKFKKNEVVDYENYIFHKESENNSCIYIELKKKKNEKFKISYKIKNLKNENIQVLVEVFDIDENLKKRINIY
jgi:hypothetical protein